MKATIVHISALTALTVFLLSLCGCGSTMPAKFYKMQPLAAQTQLRTGARLTAVGIGPVEIPGYLDHQQIVTRKAGSELGYSEYNRWAGSLRDNISDVLIEDVSAALAGEGVAVYAWDSRVPLDYQVEVRIQEFEGEPGKSVRLVAVWTVIRPSERMVVASRRSLIEKDVPGNGYAAYVDSMNGAITELGHEIADALHALRSGTE